MRVAADYMLRDSSQIIFTTIRALHRDGRFRWPDPPPPNGNTADVVASYADDLRRRPSEKMEDLLAKSSAESATMATRMRYAINRLFVMLGWNVDDGPLIRFLAAAMSRPRHRHRFISFNYDLILDRAVQQTESQWDVANGYGFRITDAVHDDPTEHPGAVKSIGLAASPRSSDRVRLIKPHGSLNWLIPLKRGYRQIPAGLPFDEHSPVVPLTPDGEIRYCASTHDFQYIWIDGEPMPVDVLPAVIPPIKAKDLKLRLFENLLNDEIRALSEADEVFIIGWSMPTTDANQVQLIREAGLKRRRGCSGVLHGCGGRRLRRLVIVNYGSPAEYYERICDLFDFPRSHAEIYNDGFVDFARSSKF